MIGTSMRGQVLLTELLRRDDVELVILCDSEPVSIHASVRVQRDVRRGALGHRFNPGTQGLVLARAKEMPAWAARLGACGVASG